MKDNVVDIHGNQLISQDNLVQETSQEQFSNADDIKNVLQENPKLKEFFRNQQRFIHLYLLSQRCQVTSRLITEMMEVLDRTFAPQTYYGTRRELEQEDWIAYDEKVTNTNRGPTEFPHYIPEKKREKFLETVIAASTIERPVVISKFHVFDLAVKLFKKQWDALLPIVKQAQGTFFTDFVVQEITGFVLYLIDQVKKLTTRIQELEQELTDQVQNLTKRIQELVDVVTFLLHHLSAIPSQIPANIYVILATFSKFQQLVAASTLMTVINLRELLRDQAISSNLKARGFVRSGTRGRGEKIQKITEHFTKLIDLQAETVKFDMELILPTDECINVNLCVSALTSKQALPIGLQFMVLDENDQLIDQEKFFTEAKVQLDDMRFSMKVNTDAKFKVKFTLHDYSVVVPEPLTPDEKVVFGW